MMLKRIRYQLCKHEHWFAECWSMLFLFSVGLYGLVVPKIELLRDSYAHGFLNVLPDGIWQGLFMISATIQCVALFNESLYGRAIAAFMGSTLLIWGGLNVLIFGAGWHFSLIAWGAFALINLYALSRIMTGIESQLSGKAL